MEQKWARPKINHVTVNTNNRLPQYYWLRQPVVFYHLNLHTLLKSPKTKKRTEPTRGQLCFRHTLQGKTRTKQPNFFKLLKKKPSLSSNCSLPFGNSFLYHVIITKIETWTKTYSDKWTENRGRESVTSRWTSSPGSGAKAWPGHRSGVGSWWRFSHRLFLGTGGKVEVFILAVGPGTAPSNLVPWSGGRKGCEASTWTWLLVCPLVVLKRTSIPGRMAMT